MANKKRLIDANARIEEIKKAYCHDCDNYDGVRCRACWVDDAMGLIDDAPTVDAVMLSDLEAWLYEIAMNNVGEKFDGDFSDAVEEIINRLDGLRVFAADSAEPTVDAVEVVRCRDCKFGVTPYGDEHDGLIECSNIHGRPLFSCNGFCSYGERRTDG